MAMSAEHKAALAKGRTEARAIRAYLDAMEHKGRARRATPETLRKRIKGLEERIAAAENPLSRVDLIQQRLDAEQQLKEAGAQESVDVKALESDFVKYVKSYSKRKSITYAAWREEGVPADVLRRAGIPRTRA